MTHPKDLVPETMYTIQREGSGYRLIITKFEKSEKYGITGSEEIKQYLALEPALKAIQILAESE